ncbi:uncharacterized protein LOC131551236 [Onychostoma macrolepis]|uniref:uncharacterized protein LOC131551236 n=1 Tax=Onychostoma macrolepis TaxID=369639 RepID=UPI00272CACC6|nr:uncharacterized protein LOC131551236 [Onychostoma macrolepis]
MSLKKCVFGCEGKITLFSLSKNPALGKQWMLFVFPGQQRSFSSVFVDQRFINKAQFDAGFVHRLILKDEAVPAIKYPSHDSELQTETGPETITSMDPRPPTPMEVLEELVYTLRASLMPVTTPQSASVCPMAMPASYAGDTAVCGVFLLQVVLFIQLINSRNLADHRRHVKQVLQRLCQHHLYLKLEKCEYHRPIVQFLGYLIGQDGIQMDQGKVTVIKEWPRTQTVKELQRFLCFANFYCGFIKDFSLHTAPLTSLLRGKPKSLSWNTPAPTKHSTS